MAQYSIECEQFLGISHSGSVTVDGESTVDLTDEEVDVLVSLIREKSTTDVDELGIEESHPDLYEKLRQAYYQMAYDAEESHWLWEGYENGYFEYDTDELMEYCKQNCGFEFEYDKDDYLDEDGELDEDSLADAESEAFTDWLDDYIYGLDDEEARNFMYNHMNADLDLDGVDYKVEIPAAIIEKAKTVGE